MTIDAQKWAGGPAFCVVFRSRSTTVVAPSLPFLQELALSLSKGRAAMLLVQCDLSFLTVHIAGEGTIKPREERKV